MADFLKSYVGIWASVAVVVGVGLLVTQGLLDGKFADIALGFLTGGAVGTAFTAKREAV